MGQIIDNRYQIIEKIGEGGMGAVYLAEDLRLRRKVAIKRLQLMGKQADLQHFQQRFEREALEMASFQHANIVHVYDYGHDDAGIYLVLEYMPGGTLSDRMQTGAVPVAEAVAIMLPLADALQAIHERERVHRDIKPSNILFDGYGKPKLADFGVVKLLAGQEGHTLTGTGAAVGTPAYMAPELIGGEASPATDLYALGVVLYELVTGKKPFLGRTPMETLFFQQTRPLPDPLTYNPHLPTWLCAVLHTMLAKDPSERFAGMPAFMEALTAGSDTPAQRQEITPPKSEPAAEMTLPQEKEHTFDVLSEAPPVSHSTILPPKKPLEKIVEIESSKTPVIDAPRQEKKGLPAWLLFGGIGIILAGIMIGIGSRLVNPGTRGSGPLAALATATATVTPTATFTHTTTTTPTVTLTPTITPTVVLELPEASLIPNLDELVTPTNISITTREKDEMPMVFIPAGEFLMGATEGNADEMPMREVNLSEYWIDMYEVSYGQYFRCVASGVCSEPKGVGSRLYKDGGYKDFPVNFISWHQANTYCKWVGGKLPTEAQWEKAARGIDGRIYPWGDEQPTCEHANYSGCIRRLSVYPATMRVYTYTDGVSPYGIYNLVGNVWEWTADWYDSKYYYDSPNEDPLGPTNGEYKVIRGGSWETAVHWNQLHSSFREKRYPTFGWSDLGFRCAYLKAQP